MLTVDDHSRDRAGLLYVYPVWSRRAGGLSIGINLNPNHACNYRCIYCQVPGLKRGVAPPIDLERLATELRGFLEALAQGTLDAHMDLSPEQRQVQDLALSGDGEPTSAAEFPEVVRILTTVRAAYAETAGAKIVLITNGSLLHREVVQEGLAHLAATGATACWFKVDGGRQEDLARINGTRYPLSALRRNLTLAAHTLPTWIQTCLFATDGTPPDAAAMAAYLALLAEILAAGVPLAGVLLYGLARPPQLPEGARLSRLPVEVLEAWADGVRALGLPVIVTP
jgi:wyosine [tRNA(Phe)-imidazoG37] synthetase (radical SAM superfamily)